MVMEAVVLNTCLMQKKPRFLKYDLSIGDCYGFDPHNLATYHQLMSHYGSMKLYYYDQYIMNDELVIQVVVI